MKRQDFFTEEEEYHKAISHYSIERDRKSGLLPEELYKKIVEKGVPCSSCKTIVNKDDYGNTVQNPKKVTVVLCRYCTSISGV